MAIQDIGLDASKFFAEMAKMDAVLASHNSTLGKLTATYIKLSETDGKITASFKAIAEDGRKVKGTIEEVNGTLETLVKSAERTKSAIEGLKTSSIADAIGRGAAAAQRTIDGLVGSIGKVGDLTPQMLTKIQKLQKDLAFQLGSDPTAGTTIAIQTRDLKAGSVSVETGEKQKQQDIAIKLLALEQQITKEIEKRNSGTTPKTTPSMEAALKKAAADIGVNFPVPSGTTISSFEKYNAAINKVFDDVRRGKITLTDLQAALEKFKNTPIDSIPVGTKFTEAEKAALAVIKSFKNLKEEAEPAGDIVAGAGNKIFLSFQRIFQILQIQVVHRFFGNLLTEMQQSVVDAAIFDQKLAEVMTLGRSVASTEHFRVAIRELASEFNRTPTDVAAGTYQALSNQMIRTAGDIEFMRTALVLARATVSTTSEAVDGLSAIMTSYRTASSEALAISNELFKAIDLGRFKMADLAQNIGRATVVTSQLNISRQDSLAFLTRATRAGLSEAEALTQLIAITNALMKPSEQMKNLFREWGVTSGEAAIGVFTFAGVLQKLHQEAERGGNRITELLPNRRALTGFRAVGNPNEFRQESANIRDNGDSAAASQVIAEAVGEQFRSEFNKVAVYIEGVVGPRILKAFMDVGKSGGGFSSFIIDVVKTMTELAETTLKAASAVAYIINVFRNLGVNLTSVAYTIGLYTFAIKVLIPLYTVMNAKILEQIALTRAAAASTNANSASTAAAATATITFTASEYAAAAATATLTAALSLASAAFLPLLAIGGTFALVSFLNAGSDSAELLASKLEQLRKTNSALNVELSQALNKQTAIFEQDARSAEQQILRHSRPLVTEIEQISRRMKILSDNIKNDLENALKSAADNISRQMGFLSERISNSNSNIRDSFKQIGIEATRTAATLFSAQQSFLGHGVTTTTAFGQGDGIAIYNEERRLALQNQVTQQQNALINQRISTLQAEAARDAQRRDREGIESARTKYAEIRRLTEQQFELERRQALEQQTFRARMSGGGVFTQRVDYGQLQRRLDDVNNVERNLERQFQNRQVQEAANAQTLLDAERTRQREITQSRERLLNMPTTDSQGQLLPQYRERNGGNARAIADFNELAAAAQAALAPIRLTADEIQRLGTRLGANQAETIRRSLAEGTITLEQRRQLENSLSNERVQLLNQELANFRQTEQQRLDIIEQIGRQRVQLEARLANERARNEINAVNQRIREEFRLLSERRVRADDAVGEASRNQGAAIEGATPAIEGVSALRNRALPAWANLGANVFTEEGRAIARVGQMRGDLDTAIARFQARLQEFSDNRTQGRAESAASALDEVRIAQAALFRQGRQAGTIAQEPGRTVDQSIEAMSAPLRELANRLQNSPRDIQQAQTTLQGIAVELANIGRNANPANPGLGIEVALGPTARALQDVAQRLNALTTELQRLRDRPISTEVEDTNFEIDGTYAAGGLIGNRFTSRGPDNRIASVRDGEFIINPESTRRYYSQIRAINAGSFAEGGLVGGHNSTIGDVTFNINESSSPHATSRAVLGMLRREQRKGNI